MCWFGVVVAAGVVVVCVSVCVFWSAVGLLVGWMVGVGCLLPATQPSD